MMTLVKLANDVIPTLVMDESALPEEVNDDMGLPIL